MTLNCFAVTLSLPFLLITFEARRNVVHKKNWKHYSPMSDAAGFSLLGILLFRGVHRCSVPPWLSVFWLSEMFIEMILIASEARRRHFYSSF